MSRQAFTIIILTFIGLIVGGLLFYFFIYKAPGTDVPKVSIGTLFPFGQNSDPIDTSNPNQTDITDTTDGGQTENADLPDLRKLWDKPVVASTSFERKVLIPVEPQTISVDTTTATTLVAPLPTIEVTKTVVRFIERTTGHVHDIYTDEATAVDVTNTTIPRLQEAYFANGGNNVIVRYLQSDNSTIETYNASVGTTKNQYGLSDVTGFYLEKNIFEVAISPLGDKIFYLYPFGDATIGVLDNLAGTNKKQILNSTFSEWLPQFASETEILLTTKASGYAPGYTYILSTTEPNVLKKILGDINGLTAYSIKNGDFVLFSKIVNKGPALYKYNRESREESSLSALGLPSKCVWSQAKQATFCAEPSFIPTGVYPDDWYQGKMFFTDKIWQINSEANVAYLISDLTSESGEGIDATHLEISPDGNYLHFINKRDGMLWGLQL